GRERPRTRIVLERLVGRNEPFDGQIASVVLSAAAFYDRKEKAFVPAERLFDLLGITPDSPPMTARIERFISSYKAFKDDARPRSLAA
ncbi:MAG: hypothetical protein AAFN27_14695, partial [Pseudomonadota bacterium]